MMGSEVFLMKPKYQFIYPNKENEFVVHNHWKNGDYYVNPCYPNWKMNFNSKNGGKKVFIMQPKYQ